MPRTILVHLNVQAPDDDKRDANAIADAVLAAYKVGSDNAMVHGLEVVCPMAEEI